MLDKIFIPVSLDGLNGGPVPDVVVPADAHQRDRLVQPGVTLHEVHLLKTCFLFHHLSFFPDIPDMTPIILISD